MAQVTQTFGNALNEMAILSSSSGTWSTVRDAVAGASTASSWVNTAGVGLGADFNTPNYRVVRGFFHYDTSSIPENATIISAFIRLPGNSTRFVNTDTTTLDIVQSTVVSNTSLADADFDLRGTTVWGELALSSWNQAGNNDIPLNATGLLNINISGYSKFSITNSRDTDNSAPTGPNSVTFDPTLANQILSVTYSIPSTDGASFLINFI